MNKIILIGRLTKKPELKTTSNNKSVCNFSIAVNRKVNNKETDFFNCQAWEKTGEFVEKYFDKGSMISIVGRVQNRSWEDKDGKKNYITEIIVEEVYFCGSKKDSSNSSKEFSSDEMKEIEDSDELPF